MNKIKAEREENKKAKIGEIRAPCGS